MGVEGPEQRYRINWKAFLPEYVFFSAIYTVFVMAGVVYLPPSVAAMVFLITFFPFAWAMLVRAGQHSEEQGAYDETEDERAGTRGGSSGDPER